MANNDKVPELTEKEFNDLIKQGTVFIDFFAEWCMPCLMMSPIIDEIADKFKNIKFGKVNIGENDEPAKKFEISSIPTFIIFKDGKVIEKIMGAVQGEELEEKLRKLSE